jgi:hypothetical protein
MQEDHDLAWVTFSDEAIRCTPNNTEPAAANDQTALDVVSCGRPLPNHDVRIADDLGHEAAQRSATRARLLVKVLTAMAGSIVVISRSSIALAFTSSVMLVKPLPVLAAP